MTQFCKLRFWRQIVVTGEDGVLKSVFDVANVHADIFQVITGSEGILTLREFVLFVGREKLRKTLDKVD